MEMATEEALLRDGDLVIQTAGTVADVSGSTDLVKVSIVGKGTVLDPTIM
jgi:pyruvate kinase